ncbi:hypothetical protein B0T19DRAFT_140353 [Cercophora scortea]|uniref:CENP-V/GFA domain-containing protein n=1 Tax=Cercophora scortea TaxID=314031 RepID=A0AAE0IZS4_9PEZI|nr:hypothetical protein B0T19DRAFT_140353 [Cercophora scortea]
MSLERPLHGKCQCGRNRYIIQAPKDAPQLARVHFNSHPSHRFAQAPPLAAFLRVPLGWYRSITIPFYSDETSAKIHRVYTSPFEEHAMRHFCGFCGTPLSYWSEEPRSEADFIHLTLGSLSPEDLADLEDLGLLPSSDDEAEETVASPPKQQDIKMAEAGGEEVVTINNRQTVGGLPWLDTLTQGSKLGHLRSTKGRSQNRSGTVRIEWEIVEWNEEEESPRNGKRKLGDRDNVAAPSVMEDIQL